MGDDRHEKIRRRAHEIWEREGRPEGEHENHWQAAQDELDREESLATTGDAPPQTGEIASSDILTVEALAMRTGITGDQAQELIDRLGNDRAALEQAAWSLKASG